MPKRLHRITQGADYRRTVREGRRVGGSYVVTHAVLRTPDDPARFGYIVSKKVGNAVMRNLITRRLREISNELLGEGLTGVDVVFRAQPAAAEATYAAIRGEIRGHLRRLLPGRDA